MVLDIYPPGGVDLVLQRTRCHPYLIQRVCDELCKRLHERRSLRATDEDLEAAFDALLGGHAGEGGDKGLQELWDQRTDDERACLLRRVDGDVPAPRALAARALLREDFLEERDGKLVIAVSSRNGSRRTADLRRRTGEPVSGGGSEPSS